MSIKTNISKSIVISLLILSLILSGTLSNAQALDQGDKTIEINEFEVLKDMHDKLINLEHENKGSRSLYDISDKDRDLILNYKENYKQHIIELSRLSSSQLEELNYNDKQIMAIKNFDGSEEAMSRASATVNLNIKITQYTLGTSSTTAKVETKFSWNGRSIGWGSDIVGIAWAAPFKESSASARLIYRENETMGAKTTSRTASVKPSAVYGSSVTFPKHIKVRNPNDYHIASGTINQTLTANSRVSDLTVYTEYGFNTVSTSPSVSINGFSLSFSKYVKSIKTSRDSR